MNPSFQSIGYERQWVALHVIAKLGHVRPLDLAAFTDDTSRKSVQQWQRTLQQLVRSGLALKRGNALGTTSYVLRHAGARTLRDHGVYEDARASTYLSPTGATFHHRSLSNMGILWTIGQVTREGTNFDAFSEYEMQRGLAPVKANGVLTDPSLEGMKLPYAPDGMITTTHTRHHLFEAELSYRTLKKLQDKLAWYSRGFNNSGAYLRSKDHQLALGLASVIFIIPVGEDWYDHESRLRDEIEKLPNGPNGQIWSFLRLPVDRRLRLGAPEFSSLIRKPEFEVNLITGKPINESSVSLYPIMQDVLRKP